MASGSSSCIGPTAAKAASSQLPGATRTCDVPWPMWKLTGSPISAAASQKRSHSGSLQRNSNGLMMAPRWPARATRSSSAIGGFRRVRREHRQHGEPRRVVRD